LDIVLVAIRIISQNDDQRLNQAGIDLRLAPWSPEINKQNLTTGSWPEFVEQRIEFGCQPDSIGAARERQTETQYICNM